MSAPSDETDDVERLSHVEPIDNLKQYHEHDIQATTAQQQSNWYAKLHSLGKNKVTTFAQSPDKKMLNLSLFFRIWLAVAIIIIISGVVVFQQLFNYVRPTTQQVIEDTLVDTAKLLAASLQTAVASKEIVQPSYQAKLDAAFLVPNIVGQNLPDRPYVNKDQLDALSTWYTHKTHSSFRVYVTDAAGIVIYDSLPMMDKLTTNIDNQIAAVKPNATNADAVTANTIKANITKANITNANPMPKPTALSTMDGDSNAEGQDYSQWRDVHLTLKGKYGARTTRKHPDVPSSSVMYVAQPIYDVQDKANTTGHQKIIGVVSVGKPTATILPYLNATRQRMLTTSLIISVISLMMAGLIAWWLKQSMMLVTRYTKSLAQNTQKPYFYLGRELNELTDTIETMKHRLENRAYVTDYVHTLTHELKSPLTAIRASGELLEAADLEEEDRLTLSHTITEQSIKLQSLIDRLLLLAKIEQPTFKLASQPIDPNQLLQKMLTDYARQPQYQAISIDYRPCLDDCLDDSLNGSLKADTPDPASSVQNTPSGYTLYADAFWLTQALQNVLDNALYFAHSLVVVALRQITLDNKAGIELTVFNDGEPIPAYAVSKVFDRYFSLSHQLTHSAAALNQNSQPNQNSRKGSRKGTGLGLTLVKQVIERHGGDVTIANVSTDVNTPYPIDDLSSSSHPAPMPSTHPTHTAHNTAHNIAHTAHKGVIVTIRLPLLP